MQTRNGVQVESKRNVNVAAYLPHPTVRDACVHWREHSSRTKAQLRRSDLIHAGEASRGSDKVETQDVSLYALLLKFKDRHNAHGILQLGGLSDTAP